MACTTFPIGSLICVRTPTKSGRIIRWGTTNWRERIAKEKTRASHIAPVVSRFEIIHAVPPRVRRQSTAEYLDGLVAEGGAWCCFEPSVPLGMMDTAICREYLEGMIGVRYSHIANGLAGIDAIPSKIVGRDVIWARKLDRVLNWTNCSGLGGTMAYKIRRAPAKMQCADPDMLYDFMLESMAWVVKGQSAGWWG